MGNQQLDKLEEYLEDWIKQLNSPNNDNQGPLCPYAKSTWDNSRAKIVKCPQYNILQFWAAVAEECEDFDTDDDITIVASDTIYDPFEVAAVVDALNVYLSTQNKDIWLLASCNNFYSMVFVQQITKLDDASKVLENTPYYAKMHPEKFNEYITRRRTLRNNLQRKTNE